MPNVIWVGLVAVLSLAGRSCLETETRTWDGSVACGGACVGSRPHCLESESVCVGCLEAAHCSSSAPLCDSTTHTCVRCAADSECPTTSPVCDTGSGACLPCSADAACAARGATPVCDEPSGSCVACTADTETARCAAYSCDRETHTCTQTLLGSVGNCGTCQSDGECNAGRVCVVRTYMDQETGTYCLPVKTAAGCGSTASNPGLLPFWLEDDVTSVEGATATVCRPADAVSCLALQRAGTECTTEGIGSTDFCGDPIVHDGQCANLVGSTFACRYTCADALDCSAGQTCTMLNGDATKVCR